MGQETWLHFTWAPQARPVVLGAHQTEASARLDFPVDLHVEDGWIREGVSPLGKDPFLLGALKDYVGLMREVEELEPN